MASAGRDAPTKRGRDSGLEADIAGHTETLKPRHRIENSPEVRGVKLSSFDRSDIYQRCMGRSRVAANHMLEQSQDRRFSISLSIKTSDMWK